MATLEKIRSKSVFLLVIIGAALIAFIIGDFFTSGRTLFGTGTTIAKVGNQKIDVQDFQRKVQEATQQAQGRQYDGAVLQQQVLDQMIAEALMDQEIKDLGLKVTDAELRSVMVGENSQYINQRVQQETGLESAQMAHDMAYNPAKYGLQQQQAAQLMDYWLKLEEEVEKMLLQQKFQNLFVGTLVANDLDTKAIYDENAQTAHMLYAKKDYSTLPDDKYPVSADDIKAQYSKDRNRYKLNDENRLVNYIAVEIQPSQADLAKADQKVKEAIKALNETEDTRGVSDMNEFVVDRQKLTAAALKNRPKVSAFVDSVAVGRAAFLDKHQNEYQLVKLLGRPTEIDSATIDFLSIQGKKAQIDSLVMALNAGASFDSIAKLPIVAGQQKATEISLLDPNMSSVRAIIEGAEVGKFFAPDTLAENGRIFRVSKRAQPATVYDVAFVNYQVEPSAATVNTMQANLQRFINKNNTAEAFNKNAQAAGYTSLPMTITPSTPQMGGLPDSHNAVAWAMDASKGQVSPIFGDEQTGRFIVVALNDIYDEGYIPVRDQQVTQEITQKLRNDRKAAALIAQYKGKAKDVPGYATQMGSKVDTAAVVFSQAMIPGLGADGKLQGRIADAKVGQLVGPVQGESGVIVFQVTSVDKEGRPYQREENAARYAQQRGAQRMGQNLAKILIGNKKVTNNMNTFYNYK